MHAGRMVIPDRHDKHHSSVHDLADSSKTSRRTEFVRVASQRFGLLAERIGDLIGAGHAWDVGVGLLNDLTILNVQATDGSQSPGGGVVVGDELCHDSYLGLAVHNPRRAVEGLVSPSVWVEIAAIFVAVRRVSLTTDTTGRAGSTWSIGSAWVRSYGVGNRVCFPNVHLGAA